MSANRRVHARQKLRSVAYIDLGPSNGGLVLNLSESGLALSTAMKLMGDALPSMRFKLPGLDEAIEAQARIVWISESKKEAGVRFERLQVSDARKINDWLLAEQGLDTRLGEAAAADGVAAPMSEPVSEASNPVETLVPPSLGSGDREAAQPPSVWLGSEEPETSVLKSSRTSVNWPAKAVSNRKWTTSAAITALIAFVSFGTGVLIERGFQHGPRNPAQPTVAEPSKGQAPESLPSSALTASERSSSDNADMGVQGGIATDRPVPDSTKASMPTSEPPKVVPAQGSANVDQRNKASERADGAYTTPREVPKPDTSKALTSKPDTSKPDTSRMDATLKSDRALPNVAAASSMDNTDRSRVASSPAPEQNSAPTPAPPPVQSVNTEASRQTQNTTIQQETAPASANEKVTSPAPVPRAVKPLSPSVAISVPPFPSMHIPPELKSQASRAGTSLQMGQLMTRMQPTYPPDAVRQEIVGTVKVHAVIGRDGAVQSVEANGPELLADAAMGAVRQWRYKPTLVDGQAIEAEEEIVFVFRLSPSNP